MIMNKKERKSIADEEAIKRLREKCSENLEAMVNAPIQHALNRLKNFAFKNALMQDVPAITISVDTFCTLVGPPISENLNESIKIKGRICGEKFAKTYLSFLRYDIGVPKSIDLLLEGWAFFDTGANWGTFNVLYEKDNKKIIITMENNFLLRGRKQDKHSKCVFIEGYIEGLLWTCLKYYPRWFEEVTTAPRELLEPVKVEEKPEGDLCKFYATLKEEELKDAFNMIYSIERRIENDDILRIPLEIRILLEVALKQKLDINKDERIYVPQLLSPFKKIKKMKIVNINKITDIYHWSSKDAHIIEDYTKEEIIKALSLVKTFLRYIELLDLNEEDRESLRHRAFEARSGGKKRGRRNVFICYSHQDGHFVDRIVGHLQSSGISVWIDKIEIKVGDSLHDKIKEGMDKMNYLAVILSPSSLNSNWVREELKEAISRQLKDYEIKVLPILYKECSDEDLPIFIREKKYADFRDMNRYDIAFEELLNSIR